MEGGYDGENSDKKVIIIGGGLVGALNACFFAKRGWKVEIYEQRPDPRKLPPDQYNGRSISLSASERARAALNAVGLEDTVAKICTRQYGRLIRPSAPKKPFFMLYGSKNEHLLSIGRRRLNEVLLTEAECSSNVSCYFEHKLLSYDSHVDSIHIIRLSDKTEIEVTGFDLACGCDGAFSRLRRSFLASPGFDFSQQWIPDCYLELRIPPKNGQFAMNPDVVQVWSCGEFCVVGLANIDGSFILNVFAPRELFNRLRNEEAILSFFRNSLPDVLEMVGEQNVIEAFQEIPPAPMISVKCKPYHFGKKVVLLGDSAHAMAPFYAQGMNCGFEDCLVLSEMLDKHEEDIGLALECFSEQRCPDCHAVNDLAMHNYLEVWLIVTNSVRDFSAYKLRKLGNSLRLRLRKQIDSIFQRIFGDNWLPLYSMVTFSRLRYSTIVSVRKRQDKILQHLLITVSAVFLLSFVIVFVHVVL